MQANVTIALDELDNLRAQVQKAGDEAAALRAQLQKAERSSEDARVDHLFQLVEALIPCVQFAVGNLDVETVRNWPHPDLAKAAKLLEHAPGLPGNLKELHIEWGVFAREAAKIEDERRRGVHKQREGSPRG